MKTLASIVLMVLVFNLQMVSQNRINQWDVDRIVSIEIEEKINESENSIYLFENKGEIHKVLSFLKNVDFNEFDQKVIKNLSIDSNWKYRIIFHGLRDWVFLFDSYAYIGKTIFSIDNNIVNDFGLLLEELRD